MRPKWKAGNVRGSFQQNRKQNYVFFFFFALESKTASLYLGKIRHKKENKNGHIFPLFRKGHITNALSFFEVIP
jgi:hypothetical protein